MNNFAFEYPYVLILLLLVICIYKCPVTLKQIIFPHIHLFSKKTSLINKEKLLYSLILTLLIFSLASPIIYDQKTSSKRKGRDLVFALDTSGSMAESGFNPENVQNRKFDALKELLRSFITKRYNDNVGVSIFGTYAYPAIPLSYDMGSVAFLLDFFDVGIAGDSTAIGEGLAMALKILKKGEAKEKVIILITDGYQNSGAVSVKEAVQKAKKQHVKIYTIGIGDRSAFDANLLQLIAKNTDAKMFEAKNVKMLQDIYKEIDKLEPSAIRSKHYLNKQNLYMYPLSLASLLLLYLVLKRKKELL
ncbi:von Willebrand factor type A [Sulfurimonas autotrophica DSM 16294]|uniref:von Willebrand factor type A n=1 Tax=Sulfurimonas autotrophica (strain ATCC BAA-671 / DSM 16294 / JCM 11897 / OK10) TaxID=563040 RepID=E0UPD2_SULAO|nr:von Willebrand factor type A [Sulfurimonas autotrophica DSM 16294]